MSMNVRFELFVNDVAKTVIFYKDILGFSVRRESPTFASIISGNVQIGICQQTRLSAEHYFSQKELNEKKGVGVEIVFEVDDIEETYHQVLKLNYPMLSELTEQPWGLWDFRIADPDGYYIRITNK